MSDDIKSGDDLSIIVIKLQNRISELEANTIISNELQIKINDKLQDYIKINTSNIQNNFKGFKDFKFLQESQMKRCDHLQEQIAELGKRIGNAWESISELEAWKREHLETLHGLLQKWGENQNNEIAELREEMKCYMEFWSQQQNQINELKESHELQKEYNTIKRGKIKEVLRELKPILLNHFEKDKIEGRLALQDLFKKLDLGDEKDWFNNGWCAPYWKAFKQHSKPPEPKKRFDLRKYIGIIDEPREDEIKAMDRQIQAEIGTHIFVKREDFEFLYEHCYLNRPNEEPILKRIKEEYNL